MNTGGKTGSGQAGRENPRTWAPAAVEGVVLAALLAGFLWVTPSFLDGYLADYRPAPDTLEYAWMAGAIAEGRTPLMPVGAYLYPPRYSVVHPAMVAAGMVVAPDDGAWLRLWPRLAVVAGLLATWLALWRAGVGPVGRLVGVYLLASSRPLVDIAQSTMQEPSMFLLVAGSLLFAADGLRAGGPAWRRHGALAFAGACAAAVGCMRLPYFLWFAMLPVAGVIAARPHIPWRAAAWYAGGGAAVVLLVLVSNRVVTGWWSLANYHYWVPGTGDLFAWRNALLPVPEAAGTARWRHLVDGVLGFEPWLSYRGAVATMAFLVLALWGVRASLRHQGCPAGAGNAAPLAGGLAGVALLTSAAYAVFQLGWLYYYERFFVLPWLLFVFAGVMGFDAGLRWLLERVGERAGRAKALGLAACLVALVLDLASVEDVARGRTPLAGELALSSHYERQAMGLRRVAPVVGDPAGPLFVFHRSVVSTRMHLGLESSPQPVCWAMSSYELDHEPHMVQMRWFPGQIAPVGGLRPGGGWPAPPECCLLWEDGSVNEAFVDLLARSETEVTVLAPLWARDAIGPATARLEQAGFRPVIDEAESGWAVWRGRRPVSQSGP